MKTINFKNTILTLVFSIIISIRELVAENEPPAPRGSGGFDDEWTVGANIDGILPVIIIVGLIYGIWAIHKQKAVKAIEEL